MHLKKITFGHYLLLRKPQTEKAGLSGHQAGATGVPGGNGDSGSGEQLCLPMLQQGQAPVSY